MWGGQALLEVVLENLRLVHAVHAGDDGIENRQDHIGRLEVPQLRGGAHLLLDQTAQSELLTKTLDEVESGEVRQVLFVEGKRDFSEAFWHCTQKPPRGVFLCNAILAVQLPWLSSRNSDFTQQNAGRIAHH